jgi:putative tricarboxylic transport membrane protein
MVLGPTLELTLRQGLILTDGSFHTFFSGSPIAIVLTLTAVVALAFPFLRSLKSSKK